MRFIAVDWSGSSIEATQKKTIWLAEARAGELIRLESSRTRRQVADHLVDEKSHGVPMVVGFDFGFSLPAWYMELLGVDAAGLWELLSAERLTARMAERGLAAWLDDPEPPFWTQAGGQTTDEQFRQTDQAVKRELGLSPKSLFKLVGAGQVGRASLTGMQVLHRLHREGFAIWPFFEPGDFTVVEIYPRLLTGPVVKSRASERVRYLARLGLPSELLRRAEDSEDAFDAAVSALAMAASAESLRGLRREDGVEGRIWAPDSA